MTSPAHWHEPWFVPLAAQVEERARIAHLDAMESNLRLPDQIDDRLSRLRVTVGTGLLNDELASRKHPDRPPLGAAELLRAEKPDWLATQVPIEELLAVWATAESFLPDLRAHNPSRDHQEQQAALLHEMACTLHPRLDRVARQRAPEARSDLSKLAVSAAEVFGEEIAGQANRVFLLEGETTRRWTEVRGVTILTHVSGGSHGPHEPTRARLRLPHGPSRKH